VKPLLLPRPTIKDVARAANVSYSTVSYILNDSRAAARISQQTKERVWAAREGHTAVRLSALARLAGGSELATQTWLHDQLIVLRGKRSITRETALKILAEYQSQLALD